MNGPASTRHPRKFRPEIGNLERRELMATAVSSLFVRPAILSPANGRYVTVTVSGKVTESSAKRTPGGQFHVIDEYARIQPHGKVVLTKIEPTIYSYSFTIKLQASRANSDSSGRQYNVIVGSQDDQNAHGLAVSVLVPHNSVEPVKASQTLSISQWRRPRIHN